MALYLANLTISHFRSHQVGRLALDGRPVAIHGANGSGKTNILEAVSLFSPGRGLRRASAQDMTRHGAAGWRVTAVTGGDDPREIALASDEHAPRQTRIDNKPVAQTDLARVMRVLWLIPAMDRLWIEGAEGRRRFLDRMTLSFYPDHAQASLDYEKTMRERNRLLKNEVRDEHWYRVLERRMADTGAAIHANRIATLTRITRAQADAATRFPAVELELSGTETPAEAADLLVALQESRFRDMAAGRTLVGPHRADLHGSFAAKGVAASECSTGEQKALLISLILSNARALAEDTGAPPILLLDEVAAHLDPDRRAALYDEICALGAQAWMTGTESGLFDALGARGQYIRVNETNGLSEIGDVT